MNEPSRGSRISVSLSDALESGKVSKCVSHVQGTLWPPLLVHEGLLDLGLLCGFALLSFMERLLFTSVRSLK